MKKYILLVIISFQLVLTGCDKYLDIKPKGFTIPEYFEDYSKLMNNQLLIRVGASYPAYLTDEVRAGEPNDVNSMANYAMTTELFKKKLYTFEHGSIFLEGETDPIWENAYQHIYVYNTVINNVMDVPDGTEADKRRLKAEAQVARAFEYLILVNAYADHYDAATSDKTLGVPILLSEDINAKYTRNTVAEVYALIKKDLDEAVPYLNTTVQFNLKPAKSVGFAFLSRMHLYMGNYAEALLNANESLKLNNYLVDYKLYTTREGVTNGRVCLISNNTVAFPQPQVNPEMTWLRLQGGLLNNAEFYATDDLLQVFQQDLPSGATDKRRSLFFLDNQAKFSASSTISFPGRTLYAPYIQPNYGLSSSEVFLTAAECEARVGDKDRAMQHINTLRNARIANNQPLTAASNEEALNIVLRERRREMIYLGTSRLTDLKRLNKDPRFAKTITHAYQNTTYTLPPNDKRYILPTPPKVVDLNPSIPVYER